MLCSDIILLMAVYLSALFFWGIVCLLIAQFILWFYYRLISAYILLILLFFLNFGVYGVLHVWMKTGPYIGTFILITPILTALGDRFFKGPLLMPKINTNRRLGGFILTALSPLALLLSFIIYNYFALLYIPYRTMDLTLVFWLINICIMISLFYVNGSLLLSKFYSIYLKDKSSKVVKNADAMKNQGVFIKKILSIKDKLCFNGSVFFHLYAYLAIFYLLLLYSGTDGILLSFFAAVIYILLSYLYLSRVIALITAFMVIPSSIVLLILY